MIFCCFITHKNFDNRCVFPTVKNMSNIFVTCCLKNNHIKCFSFLEDCCIFLQDMHFSWPINIRSALAVQEDEVKTSRVWSSLQPQGTRGTLVKTETGEPSWRLRMQQLWQCVLSGIVSLGCPFPGGGFTDGSELLIMRGIFAASPWVFAVSLYSKAVWSRIWRKTNPNHQKCECKVNSVN